MKALTLIVVTILLAGATGAAKIRRAEKRGSLKDQKSINIRTKASLAESVTDRKEKEVHKRGILHYGGGVAGQNSYWPRSYASHHGYNLRWPPGTSGFSAAPLGATAYFHTPSAFKYNNGFHYKTLADHNVLSGVAGTSAAFPTYFSFQPAASHVHPVPSTPSFVIKPGGAVVQSHSATYPHSKPAVVVKPAHTFASVAPVPQHFHPVQSGHNFQVIQPEQTVEPVAAVQPVQPVSPVQTLLPVQPIHPIQPVQPVVQVQHFKPPLNYDVTQQFPSYFQTTLVQPAPVPAIAQAPAVSFTPAQPAFPVIPTFPNPPAFPSIPAVPAVPSVPEIPTIPSIPNFPQPQVPTSNFFPDNVQPPLPQRPPLFANVSPADQFHNTHPVTSNKPDDGSAESSPHIPAHHTPSRELELPLPQQQTAQQPWKPILYTPPTAEGQVNRPSHTLLPPYNDSPAEGYLPPAPSTRSRNLQQEAAIDSSLFDNLSDADILEIFAQAHLAAQRDHHYHTVHKHY